jgi:hypothetical protein
VVVNVALHACCHSVCACVCVGPSSDTSGWRSAATFAETRQHALKLFGDAVEVVAPAKRGRGRPKGPAQPKEAPKPRGRPRKQPRCGVEAGVDSGFVAACASDSLVSLRALAAGASLFAKLAECCDREGATKDHVQRGLGFCLGDVPRPALPLSAEASLLQMWPQAAKQLLVDMGTCAYVGSGMFFAAWGTAMLTKLDAGVFEPVALITFVLFDETPLPMGVRDRIQKEQCFGGVPDFVRAVRLVGSRFC